MKIWYVEVKREDVRFGYVNAETRSEAIKKMTDTGAADDDDGTNMTIGSWAVVEAHEFTDLGHHDVDDFGGVKIL